PSCADAPRAGEHGLPGADGLVQPPEVAGDATVPRGRAGREPVQRVPGSLGGVDEHPKGGALSLGHSHAPPAAPRASSTEGKSSRSSKSSEKSSAAYCSRVLDATMNPVEHFRMARCRFASAPTLTTSASSPFAYSIRSPAVQKGMRPASAQ